MGLSLDAGSRLVIGLDGLDEMLSALRRSGYQLVGPTIRDGVIGYDTITSVADLPAGWTDEQEGGRYRLKRRDDDALFGYNVGPHSAKRYLFPAASLLWRGRREDGGLSAEDDRSQEPPPRYAFIGLRACDLHGVAIQDRVFLGGSTAGAPGVAPGASTADPVYAARREDSFFVAVNCGQAGGTCFCVSMGTGPRARSGYDLALTELTGESGPHRLLVDVGSSAGATVMSEVTCSAATAADVTAADEVIERTAASMGRTMDTAGLKELLYDNLEHPRWDDVAARCLTCGNCTMVCPTCFCFRVSDSTDLTGQNLERRRSWDSCFTVDHSYLHGGSVRVSAMSRYRQWLTHKLATWYDQFGSSGCVGCGRCITWCPVGIDLTAEVAAIRGGEARKVASPSQHEGDRDGHA